MPFSQLTCIIVAASAAAALSACATPSRSARFPTPSLPTSDRDFGARIVTAGRLDLGTDGVDVPITATGPLPADHIAYGQMVVFGDNRADAGKFASVTALGLGSFELDAQTSAVAVYRQMSEGVGWGAVARCDRFIVWTNAVNAARLRDLTVQAFPDCANSILSGDSAPPADPNAASTPPAPTPEPVVTTYTPPPPALPKLSVVSGWDDTQSEVHKAFEISLFRVTPTDGGAKLTIRVHNRTSNHLSLSPSIIYVDSDGGEFTYGSPSDCWSFAPHESDTLTLEGSGLPDPAGVFQKRDVESGTC